MTRALLSPADAAKVLCISEKQLRSLTCAGAIRYVNIGLGMKRETRRYDPDDIDQFREARKCQSTRDQGSRSTAMTSAIEASDFLARLAARRNAKQSSSKHGSGSASKD